MFNESILDAYRSQREAMRVALDGLAIELEQGLRRSGIEFYSISARLKSESSLLGKIARPDKIYESLEDLTDVLGLRVVIAFEDQLESVAQAVGQLFAIDSRRSIDKRVSTDPSSFGYRALHAVCVHKGVPWPFEIQIRTLLQHAWAEVEHDLGYKFPETVPTAIKRRFSRIAGLLEIADAEFVELRRTMASYEREVKEIQPARCQGLDAIVLSSLIESRAVLDADRDLAEALGKDISRQIFYPDYLIRLFRAAGLDSSGQILDELQHFRDVQLPFMEHYFRFTQATWDFDGADFASLQRGYSLLLLAHWRVLNIARQHPEPLTQLARFYAELDYPDQPGEALRVATALYSALHDWPASGPL